MEKATVIGKSEDMTEISKRRKEIEQMAKRAEALRHYGITGITMSEKATVIGVIGLACEDDQLECPVCGETMASHSFIGYPGEGSDDPILGCPSWRHGS